eukprot:s8220_g2.t1
MPGTIIMFGEMPEFASNEEAEIFAHCWEGHQDLLLTPDGRSQKRPRPEYPQRWQNPRQQPFRPPFGNHYGQHPRQPPQNPLRLLTRVVLQQEEVISRLRHDKAFMLFMKQTEEGTLGSLMKVANEWHRQKTQDTSVVRSPMRPRRTKLEIKAEWLTASSEWTYKTWCHTERRLKLDSKRTPLQHTEAVRILSWLLEHLSGEVIQRFGSTVQLPKLGQQGAQMATFALEISLRGPTAQEMLPRPPVWELTDEPHRFDGRNQSGHLWPRV